MPAARPKKSRGPGRPRKHDSLGSKDDIRAKLIEAALDIVRDEGFEAVTTTRLMHAIGMTQSGFYQYFRSVDECLQVAAQQFAHAVRMQMTEFRQRIWANVKPPLDDDTVRDLFARACDYSLNIALVQPGVPELMTMFFRHRNDRTPLGAALQQVSLQAREDMTQETLGWMKQGSHSKPNVAAVRVYAGFIYALWVGAVQMLIEDPKLDRRIVRDMFTRSAFAVYRANLTTPEANKPPASRRLKR